MLTGANCGQEEDTNQNTNEAEANANTNVQDEIVIEDAADPFFVGDWTFYTSGVSPETGDYGEIWNVITVNKGEQKGNTYYGTTQSKTVHVYVESDGKSVFVSQPISSTAKYLVINDKHIFMFNENATFNGRFEAEDFATGAVKNLQSGTTTMFTAMKDDSDDLMTWLEAAYAGSYVLDMVDDDALVEWVQE